MNTEKMNDHQGTDRMDTGTARMGGNKAVAGTTGGVVFASGQTIVLNGKNCVIDSTISGSSGEAVVYKVIIDGKPYALKLYKPNTPLSDTAKKVIAKIKDNPKDRIVKIYDFGKYNDQDFEIMEYAEGGTLDQYLKSNGAIHDITKIKNIVKMITEGLQQLHSEHKVIYQDLKPENIYFIDADKSSIVLADFGISGIMAGKDEEVEVTASITDLYAAPELARKGNRNEVMVTPAVDYFALGITMFELWLGEKPFKGVKAARRDYLIAEEKVNFPIDMPDDYAAIIRGLIKPQRKDRWGNEQVRKWLNGEALAGESGASKKVSTNYDPLIINAESAVNPKELAALMDKHPNIGKNCLYDGVIKEWLKKAGDLMYYEIENITSQYANDKDAGLYTAIFTLDPERPFKSRSGKICKTTEDIADAIMAESAYYMEDLKKPNANLYLYLSATESSQGKEVADTFCKYFREYSPKRALELVYLKLQSDGGITIGSKYYQSPEELKRENDSAQTDLIRKAVTEKDSMLLVWLSDIYEDNLKSTDTFSNLNVSEQFFLLGLLPFLSYKEFNDNSLNTLQYLIDNCPGRSDLFETYAAQGLPLTGQCCGDKRTPIDYAVFHFNKLSGKHGTDTIRNLIRLLCKLGADVNEYSGDGTCPLINAYNANDNNLVKLLLELGADANQYSKYKERIDEQERRDRKQREKDERIELSRENAVKTKWKIGMILQLCLYIAYLFLLWGTDIIRAPWEDYDFTFLRCLPLILFSLTIGIVSLIFFREPRADDFDEDIYLMFLIFSLIAMILIQSITICAWREDVGFLFVYLIGRIIINTLCVIPGAIISFVVLG
jgi:serine/threonine protein kinase